VKAVKALNKLRSLMGEAKADELVLKTMLAARVQDLENPNQLVRFAEELMKHGGVIEAVGRAIKIQVILHGATEERPSVRP
jgi:hypothetical protein